MLFFVVVVFFLDFWRTELTSPRKAAAQASVDGAGTQAEDLVGAVVVQLDGAVRVCACLPLERNRHGEEVQDFHKEIGTP